MYCVKLLFVVCGLKKKRKKNLDMCFASDALSVTHIIGLVKEALAQGALDSRMCWLTVHVLVGLLFVISLAKLDTVQKDTSRLHLCVVQSMCSE